MNWRAKAQRAYKADPIICVWVLAFLVAEVTTLLFIQVSDLLGWFE